MKQNLETKVGLFLMFGIAVICTLIICFGAVGDLFKPTYNLTLTFPDASGLLKGSEVYLAGAEVGKVTMDPQPVPDSQQVQVKLKIDSKVHIRDNAQFTIGSSGLLGDRFVEISPHTYAPNTPETDKAPYLDGSKPIAGTPTASIESLTNTAQPLIIKATAIADQLNDIVGRLNKNVLSDQNLNDLKHTINDLRTLVNNGNTMVQTGTDVLTQAKESKGPLGMMINDRASAERLRATLKNLEDLSANLKEHGVLFYSDTAKDLGQKEMSESLSAVVVAAGRSQRMGFDKLLTPLGGRPLLLHTLERLIGTEAPREIILVVRPGSEAEMEQVIAPLERKEMIRMVAGGAHRQDSVNAGLEAISPESEFVMVHDAARPFITRELVDIVLAAARLSDAAVCGAPCSDSLKEVGEDGLVKRTVDRTGLWAVQTPQIFRTQLLRDAYKAALSTGTIFTDDTAVVEAMGHPVRIALYHGVNLKVTTPADWKVAEVFLQIHGGESTSGQFLRKQLHDMNNHLTPLMGYAFLLSNELQDNERLKKFATSVQTAAERVQHTTAAIQKLVREIFPRKGE